MKYTGPQKESLQDIVRLMHRHHLGPDDVIQAFKGEDTRPLHELTWVHFFYYLGTLCIFSGIISYYTVYWRSISTQTLAMTFSCVGTVAFFTGGKLLQHLPEVATLRMRRYPYALLVAAAFFHLSGLFLSFDALSVTLKPATIGMIIFATLSASAWLGSRTAFREPFVSLGLVYFSFFWSHLFDRFALSDSLRNVTLGISLCLFAYYLSQRYKLVFYRLWYLLGSFALQLGVFDAVFQRKTEILFLGVVSGVLFISTRLREKALFLSGTVGLLLYINILIYRYLAKSFNVPVLFTIAGFICLLVGFFLNRWYREKFAD